MQQLDLLTKNVRFGGREGIAWIAESLSIRAFPKRLEKLPYLLPPADFGQFGY
jgi:hypothetical protein